METEEQELKRFYAELAKQERILEDHNKLMLEKTGASEEHLERLLNGCNITGAIEFVSKPTGDNQHEFYGVFKSIYVDQWSVGMDGDSFEGYIYAELNKNQWVKIPYSC